MLRLAVISLISVFLLTGCVKLDIALEVNRDSTISGSMVFAISDFLADIDVDASSTLNSVQSLINPKTPGVFITPYAKDGYTGSTYAFDRVPFSAFKSGGTSNNQIQVERTGNEIKLSGGLDFSFGDPGQSTDPFSKLIAQTLASSAEMKISVKFPVKVLSSTGTISEDGNSVTWRPKLGEKLDLATTVEIPKGLQRSSFVMYAVALVFFTIAIVLLMRKRNSKKALQEVDFEI